MKVSFNDNLYCTIKEILHDLVYWYKLMIIDILLYDWFNCIQELTLFFLFLYLPTYEEFQICCIAHQMWTNIVPMKYLKFFSEELFDIIFFKWPKSIDLATSYSYNSGGDGGEIFFKTSSLWNCVLSNYYLVNAV